MDKYLCYIESISSLMQLMFTPSIERDNRTFLEKTASRPSTDPRPSACDDDNLTFESVHDRSISFVVKTPSLD